MAVSRDGVCSRKVRRGGGVRWVDLWRVEDRSVEGPACGGSCKVDGGETSPRPRNEPGTDAGADEDDMDRSGDARACGACTLSCSSSSTRLTLAGGEGGGGPAWSSVMVVCEIL